MEAAVLEQFETLTQTHARTRGFVVEDLQAKANADGSGWIEGWAAIYGNVDQQFERFAEGAFGKSIKQRVKAGKVPLMLRHFAHGGDVLDVIGVVTEAREKAKGLWIHAELSSDELAQSVRAKINEGMVSGLSVGFAVLNGEPVLVNGKSVFEIREAKLAEVTVTVNPVNERAVITKSKSISPPSDDTTGPLSINDGTADNIGTPSLPVYDPAQLRQMINRNAAELERIKLICL